MKGNVIVVGKTSYIGGFFARRAMASDAKIISLSSNDCDFLNENEVSDFFGSLRNEPHTVVFSAVINKSVANSLKSFIGNVQIVNNLISAQKLANIESVIYLSSIDVYGREPAMRITEHSPIDPDTWYGLAKYTSERMLLFSNELTCPVTILRIPGIYGCSRGDKSMIGNMILHIRREGHVVVNGSGKTLRDYVYIGDLSKLLEMLIPVRYEGVLNIATGESHSVLEIAELVIDVLGMEADIVHKPSNNERSFDLTFDTCSLNTLFPDFRFSDLTTGISSYL